jgi:hypothetical protein
MRYSSEEKNLTQKINKNLPNLLRSPLEVAPQRPNSLHKGLLSFMVSLLVYWYPVRIISTIDISSSWA